MTEKCISDHLIIEISDARSVGKKDAVKIKELLDMDKFDEFYTNGDVVGNEEIDSYNFAFLHQGLTSLNVLIEKIINKNRSKKILFAIHNTGNPIRTVNDVIGNTYKKKDFSHESDYPVWSDGLQPLINSIKNQEEYNKYFRIVCDLIYSPLNEAMELRTQLLTPLVALDWITQMSAPKNNIKINDQNAISETKKAAIKAFNESIPEKQDSDILKYIFVIKEFEKIRKDVSENDGAISHEDLKNFASAIEAHIEQM